ncbi:(N-Acetylneuraminyl)-galactosylglucosylceramide N-acetylgalactosaminyltransferase [Sarotherodon galilaeus]
MDGVHAFLVVLLGALSSSQDLRNASVIEMRVRPGENITLYCDCKSSVGVYIVWYRTCSHEKQPSLVLRTQLDRRCPDSHSDRQSAFFNLLNPFSDFHLVKNNLSQSYDLLITNITETDEGLYYCGTEHPKVKDEGKIIQEYVHTYSNITTNVLLHKDSVSGEPCRETCWTLLYSLCPAFAVVSSLLSSLLIYYCQKTAKTPHEDEKRYSKRVQKRLNEDEELCYAALEFRQASQRPKKTIAQSSDFSTYSAINTDGMQ